MMFLLTYLLISLEETAVINLISYVTFFHLLTRFYVFISKYLPTIPTYYNVHLLRDYNKACSRREAAKHYFKSVIKYLRDDLNINLKTCPKKA